MSGRYLSIYCPYCHRYTSVDPAPVKVDDYGERYVGAFWKKNSQEIWWMGVCNYCNNPVLILGRGDRIYPTPLPSPTDKNIPEAIRNDLDEAKMCFSVSAWRGAAVMARRAIQSAAIEKGATKSRLVGQIEELKNKGLITVDLKEWADVVRWVGNDAAHPGNDNVTRDDAEDILKLAEQFLHVLYVTPALAKARKKKRGK
ncbi:MAG TPA: DUF4145 domain-containing protein [Candidatus Pacebacteria bacterium]|nr:DUF4145 domain-containing protein [Candidatus Paceibacterota bacterium]